MNMKLNLHPHYFDLIKAGKKTVEGRIATEKFNNIQIGDLIVFINSLTAEELLCCVTRFSHYHTFQEMLAHEGVENCLPGATSTQEGVTIYENLPGYKEKVTIFGVIAITITKVNN